MVAGGSGRRFGGPKQFLHLAGRPVAAWSVASAKSVCDGVVLVIPEGTPPDRLPTPVGAIDSELGADCTVVGGTTRSDSVRAGLAAVPDEASVIVVHDAARPLASTALFTAVIEAVGQTGADAAIPVLPVGDTLKRTVDATVVATVDRADLVTVQTPQAFRAAALRAAHRTAGEATDDAGLVEQMGGTVRTVEGDPRNVKLTRPADLDIAEALLGPVLR